MKQYIVKVISYPESQHPHRFLDIITDNLELSMKLFGEKRHLISYTIVEEKDAIGMDFKCELIKYRYD